MATHSVFWPRKIPWTEEPGGLQGSQSAGGDLETNQQPYSCFTMSCQFLLYRKVNLSHMYIYPLPFGLSSHSGHHSALRVPRAIQQIHKQTTALQNERQRIQRPYQRDRQRYYSRIQFQLCQMSEFWGLMCNSVTSANHTVLHTCNFLRGMGFLRKKERMQGRKEGNEKE